MNTYNDFLDSLLEQELSEFNELYDVILSEYNDDDYLSEEDSEFILEFLDSDLLTEKSYLKKVLGGGRRIRKKDTRKIKGLMSDGKGGVKRLSGSKRKKLQKMSKKAWKRGGRKSSSKKARVAKKTRKTKRKKGGKVG